MGSPLPDRLRASALVGGIGVAAMAACSYPHYGFVAPAHDSGFDDTAPESAPPPPDAAKDAPPRPDTAVGDTAPEADAAECPILGGGDACASIPKFTASKQILDGVGDEFCDVPATRFNAAAGAHPHPSPPPAGIDATVSIRAAWSAGALHLHVHVDQPKVYAPTPVEEVWQGDAIELFFSGTDALTGPYGSAPSDGAAQVLVSPDQSPASPARALVYTSGTYRSVLGAAEFATRIVSGGYEIELRLPWSLVRGTPTSGGTIGFDVGIDVRETGDVTGPKLQSFLVYRESVATTACPQAHPSCDDRTWCATRLE